MNLHFGNPWGLALLGAALPVVVLYLLRHRRPPLTVPSLILFARAQRDQQAQSRLRRLTPELGLFVQIACIITIALAAAKPSWNDEQQRTRALAIVLDCSASMAATEEDGRRRIDDAKAFAADLLRGEERGGVLLVFAGAEPRLASSSDPAVLQEELAAHDADDTGADLERAVELAEEKLRGHDDPRIVVLTDVNARYETHKPYVQRRTFGAAHDNLAIFSARAEQREEGHELTAVIHAYTTTPRSVRVALRPLADKSGAQLREAEVIDTREVQLEPGGRAPVRFVVPAGFGAYELTLENTGDALTRDDRAVVVALADRRLPVVLVAPDPRRDPIARVLLADPSIAAQLLTPSQHASAVIPNDALEIFVGVCPNAEPNGVQRRGRDAVVFAPPSGRCFEVDVADPSEEVRTINGFRSVDPRVRFLSLDDVHAKHATTLRPRGSSGVLAEDRKGALIVDASSHARMITVVGFDLAHSDFADKRSFVVFLRNLTELAARHRARAGRSDLRAGEAASLPVPDRVTEATLHSAGIARPLRAHGGEVTIAPLPRAALATLVWKDPEPGVLLVPVAMGDHQESDLRTTSGHGELTTELRALHGSRWDRGAMLRALCVLALALLTFDVIAYGRRPNVRALLRRDRQLGDRT